MLECGTRQDEEGIVMCTCVHVNGLHSHRLALGEITRPTKIPKMATQTPASVNTASLDHPEVFLGVMGAAFTMAVMVRRWNRKRYMGVIVGYFWWGVQYNRLRFVGLNRCSSVSFHRMCPQYKKLSFI